MNTAQTFPQKWGCLRGDWTPRAGQAFSAKVDPGEILREYRTTQFPERFYNYNLKIGIPWADLERRLYAMTVLALCTETPTSRPPATAVG